MPRIRWTIEKLKELEKLSREKSNVEIAKYFNISVNAVHIALQKHGIKRDKYFVNILRTRNLAGSHKKCDQSGENNPNWQNGISKNKYRYKKIQMQRYPERSAARLSVRREIRSGRLKRGNCEICKKQNAEAHHDDYSKPLEVRWFCRKHHREYHEKLNKGK
jgi:membrane-bound lytic murein transglycosylase